MDVVVAQRPETLMDQQLDHLGGQFLRRSIERLGIEVVVGAGATGIVGAERVEGLVLASGRVIPAELVVLACGIRPRVDAAVASGLEVARGIVVNDSLATSKPGVFAVGECAEHDGRVYGIVTPIWDQCVILASILTSGDPRARYRGSKTYTRLKVAGVGVASMGLVQSETDADEVIQVIEERKGTYRKLIVRDGRLVGAILVGQTDGSPDLAAWLDRGDELPPNRLDILCSGDALAASTDPEVCNCHHVTESRLVAAIPGRANQYRPAFGHDQRRDRMRLMPWFPRHPDPDPRPHAARLSARLIRFDSRSIPPGPLLPGQPCRFFRCLPSSPRWSPTVDDLQPDPPNPGIEAPSPRNRILIISTWAFTALFAVWLMLGVLGIEIKKNPSLMVGPVASSLSPAELKAVVESRFEWLLATAILAGALPRLYFGILADKYGGRVVMASLVAWCAIPTYLLGFATTYTQLLLCAVGFGLAGNSFTAGISWNSAWFPDRMKGLALGVFGAGNVGASGTKLLVVLWPGILAMVPAAGYLGGWIPGGWRFVPTIYAGMLLATALLVLIGCPREDRKPGAGRSLAAMLAPLRFVQVWRFSLYYAVVFGAYVAISAWLPSYFKNTFHVELQTAALLTSLYIFPAALLRPLGGYLSDKYGPRVVTYGVFLIMIVALVPLCLPTEWLDLGIYGFTALMGVVGVGMGIGKASVYKYIPNYYPDNVGSVGGLVGAVGAMGGFLLPPAFGAVGRWTSSPQSAFLVLLGLTVVSLAWLHLAVIRIKARERGEIPATAAPAAVS